MSQCFVTYKLHHNFKNTGPILIIQSVLETLFLSVHYAKDPKSISVMVLQIKMYVRPVEMYSKTSILELNWKNSRTFLRCHPSADLIFSGHQWYRDTSYSLDRYFQEPATLSNYQNWSSIFEVSMQFVGDFKDCRPSREELFFMTCHTSAIKSCLHLIKPGRLISNSFKYHVH